MLTAKGLVESRTKAGTRVLPRHRWNLLDPDVLAWAFAGEPDRQFVRDLFELRAIVEPAAAGLAAARRDRDDLQVAEGRRSPLMRRHTLATDAGRAADRDFHDAILVATRNDALQRAGRRHRRGRELDDAVQAAGTGAAPQPDSGSRARL